MNRCSLKRGVLLNDKGLNGVKILFSKTFYDGMMKQYKVVVLDSESETDLMSNRDEPACFTGFAAQIRKRNKSS